MTELATVPPDLPRPVDDGRAAGLVGRLVPAIPLLGSRGIPVRLDNRRDRLNVVFVYPHMADPREGPPGGLDEWTQIPGARGCTAEACGYRDRFGDLRRIGAKVYGLSTQDGAEQRDAIDRLHLPYELLSDRDLVFASALDLPTWQHRGQTFLARLTLVVKRGRIAWVEYPVFPPDRDADRVLEWLTAPQ
jgi:peroxiredoxin